MGGQKRKVRRESSRRKTRTTEVHIYDASYSFSLNYCIPVYFTQKVPFLSIENIRGSTDERADGRAGEQMDGRMD